MEMQIRRYFFTRPTKKSKSVPPRDSFFHLSLSGFRSWSSSSDPYNPGISPSLRSELRSSRKAGCKIWWSSMKRTVACPSTPAAEITTLRSRFQRSKL